MFMLRQYLFPTPEGDVKGYLVAFFVLVALLLIGVLLGFIKKPAISLQYLSRLLIMTSILGIILYWFRLEGVLYFDANFWIWALGLMIVLGFVGIIVLQITRVPRIQREQERQNIKSKYLPKKKLT